MHHHAFGEQLPEGLLLYTATLLGSGGKWDFFSEMSHCRGAPCIGAPSVHRSIAREHWAVELFHYNATP